MEVIAGPMYCGKTEELIRQVKRAVIGKKRVQVFKHEIDRRYSVEKKLHAHNGVSFDSDVIQSAGDIVTHLKPNTEIVAIDEAQWFGEKLVTVVEALFKKSKKVLVAGLAMTFDRQPFIPMPTLMAMADKVTKLSAICSICGEEAVFHKRITKAKTTIDPLHADPSLVGKIESYQARCRRCFGK